MCYINNEVFITLCKRFLEKYFLKTKLNSLCCRSQKIIDELILPSSGK